MILRTIEAIRQKPKSVRQSYAFIVTAGFTAMVAGLWVLTLPSRFVAVESGPTLAPIITESQTASAPFASIWAQLKDQFVAEIASSGDTLAATSTPSASAPAEILPSSIELESGSTITFGSAATSTAAAAIQLTTSSTTATTSPSGN